jgi:uncharacterized protein involved in type VI secretion and phage assembly
MSELAEALRPPGGRPALGGVVTAVVTNNQDPDGLGRVKVRFPWLSPDDESAWARIAAPMAGKGSGAFLLPDVDDEVLVAFEHGDIRFPYVLGALWRTDVAPPTDNADGANAVRVIRSPSGLSVTFDDQAGTVVIADAGDKAKVTVADGKVTVEAPDGIEVKSSGGTVKLEGTSVEIKATGSLKLEATGNVDVKGSVINLG